MTTTLIAMVTVTASFVTTVNLTACVVTVAGRMRPTHLLRATALWRRALTRQLSATMAAAACTYTVAEQTVRVHAMRRVCYDNAYTRNSQFSCVCPCFYYCGVSFWHNRAGNPALNTDFTCLCVYPWTGADCLTNTICSINPCVHGDCYVDLVAGTGQ